MKAVKLARFFLPFILGGILSSSVSANGTKTVEVGSKKFTESVILGELVVQLGQHVGFQVRHRRELGGTRVLWNALLAGEIDMGAALLERRPSAHAASCNGKLS